MPRGNLDFFKLLRSLGIPLSHIRISSGLSGVPSDPRTFSAARPSGPRDVSRSVSSIVRKFHTRAYSRLSCSLKILNRSHLAGGRDSKFLPPKHILQPTPIKSLEYTSAILRFPEFPRGTPYSASLPYTNLSPLPTRSVRIHRSLVLQRVSRSELPPAAPAASREPVGRRGVSSTAGEENERVF